MAYDAVMAQRAAFADGPTLCKHLATQLSRGRFALILGAGVSAPFGLPSWQELVNRIYEDNGRTPPAGVRPEKQAEKLRVELYARTPSAFLDAVSKALYRNIVLDRWAIHCTRSLAAVATVAMAAARVGVGSIITFNFDDLLEFYFEQHGFVAMPITSPTHWAMNSNLRVYHPHGLLPVRGDRPRSDTIVLDQKSFSETNSLQATAWNQELLGIFRSHTCVFIGLSGDDPHLDTLLNDAYREHAAKVDGLAYWGVRLVVENDGTDRIWEDRGIFVFRVDDYQEALPNFLMDVCDEVAKLGRPK